MAWQRGSVFGAWISSKHIRFRRGFSRDGGTRVLAGSEFRPGPSGRQAALPSDSISGRVRAISRRDAPEACRSLFPLKRRAQGRPGARCTRGLACNCASRMRTRAYRFSGEHPAFPAQWFTAYFVLSPVNGSFATVATQGVNPAQLDASTAASGPHDFAVRVTRARLAHALRPPHLTARS